MSGSGGSPLLRVEGLRSWFPIRRGLLGKTVGHVQAVTDVDLEIQPGSTLALVGESGCGKTTVGRSILRLTPAQAGRVLFDGVDLLSLSRRALIPYRRQLQIVFQDPMASLDPRMRIRDAVAEGMRSFHIGANEAERTQRVAELLERVQLNPDQMWRYPHEFSGGQRQRICIARALAVEPRLIVCDEAVSALDVSIQAQILNLLGDLQRDLGLAYLFITHDLGVVRYLAQRVAVMYLGQIVEEGSTEQIFDSPRHPYTEGLLAAVPSVDPDQRGGMSGVEGDVPSPANPPSGCHFHTRCPAVFDRCRAEAPPLFSVGESRSRCFRSLPAGGLRVQSVLQSDRGLVRAANEDAHGQVTTPDGPLLLVVADGVGGHVGGEVASQMALEAILEFAASSRAGPDDLLREAIAEANDRIMARGGREPELAGMGTTVVALLLARDGDAWTAHVGDSRAYRQREGHLEAITEDHSLVAELQHRGALSEEEAWSDPRRNQLTRCLGLRSEVEVDVARVEALPGDRFLLCSDGLSGVVKAPRIEALLAGEAIAVSAQGLVAAANDCGGPDNVTVALAWLS
ncbi:MAG: Stp1/IreP family PP2C-type Ser/Thr phosphatase [Myxococcota bacterium]